MSALLRTLDSMAGWMGASADPGRFVGVPTPHSLRVPFDGAALDVWVWDPGRPSAVLVHDADADSASLTAFIPALRSAGLGVVAFDLGPSARGPNRRARAVAAVVAAVPTVRVGVGIGCGATALARATDAGVPLVRAAFLSPSDPAARPTRWPARVVEAVVRSFDAEPRASTAAPARALVVEAADEGPYAEAFAARRGAGRVRVASARDGLAGDDDAVRRVVRFLTGSDPGEG